MKTNNDDDTCDDDICSQEEKKIEIFAPSDWDIINQQLQESGVSLVTVVVLFVCFVQTLGNRTKIISLFCIVAIKHDCVKNYFC